ncbi:unnamed protein product [Arabidopsis halleri]
METSQDYLSYNGLGKTIWFKHGIPRCRFITWLAVRDRLSTGVRMQIAGKLLRQQLDPDWDITLHSLVARDGRTEEDILLRLCFQITVYYIWRERNARIHNGVYSSAPQMVKLIDKIVRNRIASLNYTSRPQLRLLLQRWFAVAPT